MGRSVQDLRGEHRGEIAALCERYRVRRLDLFGSAARGADFDPERSDLDLLVEYEPEHAPPSLAAFLALREALAALCGRPVDLVIATGVRNPFIRATIERSRKAVYGA